MLADLLRHLRPRGLPDRSAWVLRHPPGARLPGPPPLGVLLEGFRLALGLSELALYRAEAEAWVLAGASSAEGRHLRERVPRAEGVMALQERARDGRVSVPAGELRPAQLPFSGGPEPRGVLSLAPVLRDGAARALWLVLSDATLPEHAPAALDAVSDTLLDLDAQARRIAGLEAWTELLDDVVRFGEELRPVEAPERVAEHVSGLLEGLLGPHRLAVLELAGERAGEARLLGASPREDWPATWPLTAPVPRDGFSADSGALARARAEALLPEAAGDWFRGAQGWFVLGVAPSPLLSAAFVVATPAGTAFQSQDLCSMLALALRTTAEHLHELVVLDRLRSLAIADHLTGVHNKRYFVARLAEEVLRARRHGRPFALVMLDLDHFKRVNDTHGHDAGDAVLRELGALLRALARGDDVPARYGGEEFAVLLPDTDLQGAHAFAERLRVRVEALDVIVRGVRLPITASLGVALHSGGGTSGDDLVKAADEALYRAKQSGRNRVVVTGDPR